VFQALVYCTLLASMIDLDDPYNPIHIPPVASTKLRIAQGIAIPIAVIINFDIMVAMNNLLNPPDEIISMDEYSRSESSRKNETAAFVADTSDSTNTKQELSDEGKRVASSQKQNQQQQNHPIGMSFQVANILRLLEGCLSIVTSFLLIVQSANVIDLFIRFAAVEFVIHMDNLSFALAEHGLIGTRLQKAALHLNSLGYRYPAANPRTRKKRRGGSCTSAKNLERASRFSYFKKMFLYRLFRSPAKLIKNSPEATRKATLIFLLFTLITSWVFIIAQQSDKDYLCKNINVEFFHAHIPHSQDSSDGIKPFLSSRSGTYVAMFDHSRSIIEWISNLRSDEYKSVLGYRKANEKVEPPFQSSASGMEPRLVAPEEYVDVVVYDPIIKRWVFATCDPNADLIRDRGISCVSPELHSAETDEADLVLLSSSAFHLYSNPPAATAMFLPASVSCNECVPRSNKEDYEALGTVDPMTCVDSGGFCSDPQEELGWSRNCVCPDGQYGLHCNEFYESSCPTLQFVRDESVSEKPGDPVLQAYDLKREFKLLSDERGIGNSPIWERSIESLGFTDRIERRGGTFWVFTRHSTSSFVTFESSKTIAMAEDLSATDGIAPGVIAMKGLKINEKLPPAGLQWYKGKNSAWGPEIDLYRPFSMYQLECKAAEGDVVKFGL